MQSAGVIRLDWPVIAVPAVHSLPLAEVVTNRSLLPLFATPTIIRLNVLHGESEVVGFGITESAGVTGLVCPVPGVIVGQLTALVEVVTSRSWLPLFGMKARTSSPLNAVS